MIRKAIATLLIFIFLILCMFSLSGCYNARGIETLAYAVAIGIDKGEKDNIRLSLQFAVLSENAGESSR